MSIYTKCIIIGDIGVGKSSIIMRYTDNIYLQHDYDDPTIGVGYMVKRVNHLGGQIKICIWDASGYPSYRSIVRSYYKHVNLVILVYDVTNRDSFDNLDIWVEDVKKHTNAHDIILVANKVDEYGIRLISPNQGDEYARKNGMQYIETSAKNDMNIDTIFSQHIHDMWVDGTTGHTDDIQSAEREICSFDVIIERCISIFGI